MDQQWLKMANLIFDLEKKVVNKTELPAMLRIYDKMKGVLEEAGILLYNPEGENYAETRTDVEASISGPSTIHLRITEVIKPVVYRVESDRKILIQKGLVIVAG